jgi:hypothetical protein
MITIDIDRVAEDVALIIAHPTGVIYQAQAGGMLCSHPECEGFVICLGAGLSHFDDCGYGCDNIGFEASLRDKLATDLDPLLQRYSLGWTYQISFDFDRIDELQEGWWPVLVKGKMDGRPIDWRGYIHTGNCD